MKKTIAQRVLESKRLEVKKAQQYTPNPNDPDELGEGFVFDKEEYDKAQEPVDAIYNEIKQKALEIQELASKLVQIDENFKYEAQEINIAASRIIKEATY